MTTGANRVATIERMILDTGEIPTGPCRIDDIRYGSHTTEGGYLCDAHRYPQGSGYWKGRCPNGRIADWIARRHQVSAEREALAS